MSLSTALASVVGSTKALAVLGAVAAAGTAGGLTVAAAASGAPHGSAAVVPVVASSHPVAPTADDSNAPDADNTPDNSANKPAVNVSACPSGQTFANHGAYVSSVAQATPTDTSSPNAHGQAVAAAAQSDCGKPTTAESGTPSTGKPTTPNAHANSHAANGQSHAVAGGNNATNHPTGKPATPGAQASSHPTGKPTS